MILLRFALVTTLLTFTSFAADEAAVVRASGEGAVSLKPDQATVTIGVVSQAPTADAASAQNAKQLTAVLDQLKAALGSKADIRTSGYSLNPNYKYAPNAAPSITGYTASNSVIVKVDDLTRLGGLIDSATRTGANNIQGITFGLKDERSARAEALAIAAKNARANAEAIAASLGVRVVRVRLAESSDASHVIPPQTQFRAMAAEARAPTPVESGTLDIRATVTIVLEVAP